MGHSESHKYYRMVAALIAVVLIAIPAMSRADALAYIRANTQLQRAQKASKYHPLNLLDDDPATVWCEGDPSDGEGQEVRIFFKRPQRIDRIVLTPAAGTGRIIETVALSDGTNTVHISLGNTIIEQPVTPPMRGNEYTLTIEAVGPRNEGSSLDANDACLADVMLYFKKRPFGGKTDPSSFRYDVRRDKLLGRWLGGPLGAPEKYLTFAIDGTWTWHYDPILGAKRCAWVASTAFEATAC